MKGKVFLCCLLAALAYCKAHVFAQAKYPGVNQRVLSPGNTRYYVDPKNGDDSNAGTNLRKAWKTFGPVNRRVFAADDKITITGAANFKESLFLVARGSSKQHVKVMFLKGDYNFYPENSFKKQFFISNTNDDAYTPKAIAIYVDSSQYVDIEATGAKMIMRGKMMETCVDHSQNISIHGIAYDYQRPTVSELQVIKTGSDYAELKIHPDSKYSIRDSLLTWEGEGWRYTSISLWQVLDPATGDLQRVDINMDALKYAETGTNLVRVFFIRNPGFKEGLIYQNRDITRDCTGIFLLRSKNLMIKNVHINFMHGMGLVSQFCDNILMDSVFVRPAAKSGRTSAAWADILHFSGCRGKIAISNSYLSGANDDAVNLHGTYLRIIDKPEPNQILVRFMHGQTFGFDAFSKGDSIGFVHSETLLQYGVNVVSNIQRVNDKDILLTLKNTVPANIDSNDVVENITWTPEVYINHNTIVHIPTRGVLVTSRRKVVIQNNVFQRIHGSAISIADDAASWFESGMVKNVLVRCNQFNFCGGPVISIAPENTKESKAKVHQHITVADNQFNMLSADAYAAKSSSDLRVINNLFKTTIPSLNIINMVKFYNCYDTRVSGNKISYEK